MNGFKHTLSVLIITAISGCANVQHEPTNTNFKQAGIEANDSNALKIHKLAKTTYKIYDIKVSSEKFEKGGYGLGLAAVDVTTGALGVGLSNSAGLSGALSSVGIGLLLSPSKKPSDSFISIRIIPKSMDTQTYQEDLGLELLAAIPHTDVVSKDTRKVVGQEYYFTTLVVKPNDSASPDLKARLDNDGNFRYVYTTNLRPASSINGKLLEPLLGMKLNDEDYNIYAFGIFPEMANDFITKKGYTKEGETVLLYVPPRILGFTKLPEIEKHITKYPYLYNLNTDRKMLFISPKA